MLLSKMPYGISLGSQKEKPAMTALLLEVMVRDFAVFVKEKQLIPSIF